MQNEPLISVIVPVYKAEQYLDRCVQSIVDQTYKNLEIILVDDGSPDNCPAMCDAWAEKDSRVRVIHKENGGVASARNVGLDNAVGQYISFVDSDDWIDSTMIAILAENIEHCGADISGCWYSEDNADGSVKPVDLKVQRPLYQTKEPLKDFFCDDLFYYLLIWSKLYKSTLIAEVRFDETLNTCEDVMFMYSVLQRDPVVVLDAHTLYHYCITQNSLTRPAQGAQSIWSDNVTVDAAIFQAQQDGAFYQVAGERLIRVLLSGVLDLCKAGGVKPDAMAQFIAVSKAHKKALRRVRLRAKTAVNWRAFLLCPHLYSKMLRVYFAVTSK